jgi:esterase/lipase superfamily enzyme
MFSHESTMALPIHNVARLLAQGRTGEASRLANASLPFVGKGVPYEDIQLSLDVAQELLDLAQSDAAASIIEGLRRATAGETLPASTCIDIASLEVEMALARGRPDAAIDVLTALEKSLSERFGSTSEELVGPLETLIVILESEGRLAETAIYRIRLDAVKDARGYREPTARTTMGSAPSDGWKKPGKSLRLIDVFYFTHRARVKSPTAMQFYGGGRGSLEFGTAQAAVREDSSLSALPADRMLRLEFRDNAADAAFLRDVSPLAGADPFLAEMRSALARSERSEMLLFVHGFNVSFRAAVERSAKISVDLDIDGATVLYSWPSQASVLSYFVDRNNQLERYVEDLATVLARIATELRPASLLLIAHSMGNEFLLSALQVLHRKLEGAFHVSDVVFASPDVDREDFVKRVTPLVNMANRMTLYASKRDRALQISEFLQSYDRAGNASAPAIVPGIDTIDTSFASKGLLGHADFAGSGLDDLRAIAWTLLTPDRRALLAPTALENGVIWRMLSPSLRELTIESHAFGAALTLARRMGSKALEFAQAALASSRSEEQFVLMKGKRLVETLPRVLSALRINR